MRSALHLNKPDTFLKQSALYLLCAAILGLSTYLLFSLFRELTTPNYNFYGTHYDFLAFYGAGKTVLNHNVSHLYDMMNLTLLQREIIPHPVGATGYMPFLNPPFVAVLLAPLAFFSINVARLLWLIISIALTVFIILNLVRSLQLKQKILALALLLFTFPLFQTFIEGQVSILILLSACVSFIYFKRRQKFLSGASLVLLWILPQFGIFTATGLIVRREWQILKGWLASTTAILLITLPVTGARVYVDYIKLLINTTSNHFINMNTSAKLTWRGALNMSSGLNGFFDSLIGDGHTGLVNGLYIISSIGLLAMFFYFLKTAKRLNVKQEALFFSAAIFMSTVINPHLYAQDAIVLYMLLPSLFVLYKRHRMTAVILVAALSDVVFIDQYSRLHFFTLISAIAMISYILKTRVKISMTASD